MKRSSTQDRERFRVSESHADKNRNTHTNRLEVIIKILGVVAAGLAVATAYLGFLSQQTASQRDAVSDAESEAQAQIADLRSRNEGLQAEIADLSPANEELSEENRRLRELTQADGSGQANDDPTASSEGGPPISDRLQLPVGTSWDVDNWEESDDFDTWDFVLGSDAVKFHEWAEAGDDWTLERCEDPEFKVWSDSVNWIDVDSEHTLFCVRTTTGATALLQIVEMPDWDQLVRRCTVEVTRRG